MRKLKIGINGIGRIGKAIIRNNLNSKTFELVHINDINPDIDNVIYQLNYDTLYGNLIDNSFYVRKDDFIANDTDKFSYSNYSKITDVKWDSYGVDIVIDSSGIKSNVLLSHDLVNKSDVKHVVVTHSPDEVDFTMILGVNSELLDLNKHKVISSSICDATALAPVLKEVDENFGILNGYVTTLHPWLNYQKLMDGPSSSWSVPGKIFHHYALGRSSIGNMIPKPTTAMDATFKVLPNLKGKIGSFSYRTPTNIVGSADITLTVNKNINKNQVMSLFEKLEKNQINNIFNNTSDPLVSLDFIRTQVSVNIDHRWTDVVNGNLLKLVLWYDNEWGYSSKVVEQIKFISQLILK